MSKVMANGDKDREVKTQVRFDNLKEGLVLGVRQGAMGKWEFFPPGKLPPTDDLDSMEGVSVA